jgi:hypothetical protein
MKFFVATFTVDAGSSGWLFVPVTFPAGDFLEAECYPSEPFEDHVASLYMCQTVP